MINNINDINDSLDDKTKINIVLLILCILIFYSMYNKEISSMPKKSKNVIVDDIDIKDTCMVM